jgi:hypothetical protein
LRRATILSKSSSRSGMVIAVANSRTH